MIALPLLWGQGLAVAQGQPLQWTWLIIAAAFGVLSQQISLYLNDYADEVLDRRNDSYWLSGGSRVLPEGLLEGTQLRRGARLGAVLILLLGVLSAIMGRPWMPLFAAIAVFLAWSYSLPPVKASYRGYGELHQGISCGVFLPTCGFYSQTGGLATIDWSSLLSLGLVYFASNIITALPDRVSDREGGKRSYPVRHGAIRARMHAMALSGLAFFIALPLSQQQFASHWAALLVCAPSLILVLSSIALTRLKPFMIRLLASHAWFLLSWTTLLFWFGLHNSVALV